MELYRGVGLGWPTSCQHHPNRFGGEGLGRKQIVMTFFFIFACQLFFALKCAKTEVVDDFFLHIDLVLWGSSKSGA